MQDWKIKFSVLLSFCYTYNIILCPVLVSKYNLAELTCEFDAHLYWTWATRLVSSIHKRCLTNLTNHTDGTLVDICLKWFFMHVPCGKMFKYKVPFCKIRTQKLELLVVLVFIFIIDPFLTLVLHDQCLRPPYGVLYLATKRNYVGFNNGARQLRSLVDEEGIFGAHLVKEMTDRDVWKFFFKWTKVQNSTKVPANSSQIKILFVLILNLYITDHRYHHFFLFLDS